MSTDLTESRVDLTIQQVARRTGLAESALRYYERIGLIDPVPRDDSSGHRRYPPDLVAAVEALACLRGSGMSVTDMRAYVANMRRGAAAAADQHRLFAGQAGRLRREVERLQVRARYVEAKAELWAARERDDAAAEQRLVPVLTELADALLADERGTVHE
ncbi:MerR family DNA-binding transcriptional regulator [Mycobacterium sp. PS03-16]|uniref:MerR family transcriptional regulator n=1 Tax=Mycobacterium sp. PS03-16 TaxID=2559611 RepID=UPI0010734B02|nr:MerR family transcriptional regulator [Mycobacterium sp. PS03-16]TFV58869.1 MerR family DNA-binding transcriptional regulator [Mycobacterium sp. PS03-16]